MHGDIAGGLAISMIGILACKARAILPSLIFIFSTSSLYTWLTLCTYSFFVAVRGGHLGVHMEVPNVGLHGRRSYSPLLARKFLPDCFISLMLQAVILTELQPPQDSFYYLIFATYLPQV
ncbi:hypothetical protein BDZ97DRAFT_111828 [Flammula alnicola]|nr:hypothetical protein BDZ97DRAFT_111828 [Flammula alnicola]